MQAFTVSAAARLCGVDRRTLQRAIQAGRFPLDAQHCLSREALIAAGYLDAVPHSTPPITPQGAPQRTLQELMQATALLAILERLTPAITALHAEVRSLREDLRPLPQGTPRQRARDAAGYAADDVTGYAAWGAAALAEDPRATAVRIRDLRQQGLSYTMIALQLTREGIPTRYGKPWEHRSVRYVLETYGSA